MYGRRGHPETSRSQIDLNSSYTEKGNEMVKRLLKSAESSDGLSYSGNLTSLMGE